MSSSTMNEDASLNRSIEEAIALMEQEIERLKVSLDTFRLLGSDVVKTSEIRWHINQIDERQSALEQLKKMVSH